MPSRRTILLLLVLPSLLCSAFGPPRLANADCATMALAPHQIRQLHQPPLPDITAEAAILVNNHTGEILFARNEHERRAPASLTKMITALVALDRGRLDQEMRVTQSDVRYVWSAARLQNGEPLTLYELLYVLLLPSDNAASLTIARTLGGDVKTYVGWMNDLVASWGLKDTRFGNPHGLDHEENYTTAFEAAIMARLAMHNPVFADIVGRSQEVVAGRLLESTNELLNTYPGTLGVKTGTTDLAGENLVTMVDRPGGEVICVVMGSQDRFYDTRLLLDYYYGNFCEVSITLPETALNRYRDIEGNWHYVRLEEPMTLLVAPWKADTLTLYRRIDNLDPQPNPDEPIGVLQVSLAGQQMSEVPLYVR